MKYVISGIFGLFALAVVAMPASAASENASPKACFGQDRAVWLSQNSGREWGEIARVRAGDNAAINHAYMEGCQPAE